MKINDAIFGFILLLLGGAVLLTVQSFPTIPGQKVGPAMFPGLIAVGLCVGGLMLIARGWGQRAESGWLKPGDWVRSPRHLASFATLVAGIVFYMLASETLGFLLCSVLILLALFLVLQVRLVRALVIAVLVSLLIHLMFYKLLRVPLPWGLLQGVAW